MKNVYTTNADSLADLNHHCNLTLGSEVEPLVYWSTTTSWGFVSGNSECFNFENLILSAFLIFTLGKSFVPFFNFKTFRTFMYIESVKMTEGLFKVSVTIKRISHLQLETKMFSFFNPRTNVEEFVGSGGMIGTAIIPEITHAEIYVTSHPKWFYPKMQAKRKCKEGTWE